MTLIDLRLQYKRETGDGDTPISHDYFSARDYILWLEDMVLELRKEKEQKVFILQAAEED